MKTYSAKLSEIQKKWVLVDATDLVLGRVAAEIAKVLRGKHKPTFTPHLDCGDNVIVINAEKIHLTGKKLAQKEYHWHTEYPGGWKTITAGKVMEGRFPDRVLRKAVERMITRNPLGSKQMSNLYIYAGSKHPHESQKPEVLDLGIRNSKNRKNK